jgi:hypothetical protein
MLACPGSTAWHLATTRAELAAAAATAEVADRHTARQQATYLRPARLRLVA